MGQNKNRVAAQTFLASCKPQCGVMSCRPNLGRINSHAGYDRIGIRFGERANKSWRRDPVAPIPLPNTNFIVGQQIASPLDSRSEERRRLNVEQYVACMEVMHLEDNRASGKLEEGRLVE